MANALKGGKRPGAGRKPGSTTKRTQAIAEAAMASGITPLEFMLDVMRKEPSKELESKDYVAACVLRFEAAKAAAPYMHPRLAAIEHTGGDGAPLMPPVINLIRESD